MARNLAGQHPAADHYSPAGTAARPRRRRCELADPGEHMPAGLTERPPPLICSFCGRSEDEVSAIVGGPSAFICNLCHEIAGQAIGDIAAARPRVTIDATTSDKEPA